MKLLITLQFLLLLIVGLPILAVIIAIATIDRLIDRVPDITITWRNDHEEC